MSAVITSYMESQLLAAATNHTSSGNFDGPLRNNKIGIFTAISGSPTKDTLYADLTKATYTGSAEQALTWSAAYVASDGSYAVLGGLVQFEATVITVAENVLGYYITDGGGTPKLLLCELFENPVAVSAVSDSVNVVPQFKISEGDYGSGTLVA